MSAYRLSPEAREDIDEIWDHIAEDDPGAATRFTEILTQRFGVLARYPFAGRSWDALRPGLYRFPVGNYLIVYRPDAGGVEIARVLHGARDIEALFPPGGEG